MQFKGDWYVFKDVYLKNKILIAPFGCLMTNQAISTIFDEP